MGNLLNRDKLLTRQVLKIKKVDLEDGDYVYVREMTARERDTFEQSLTKEVKNKKDEVEITQDLSDFRAKMAVVTICDEKGDLLLKPEDCSLLSQSMGIKRMEAIVEVAQKLNKITKEDKEALLKNSAAVPGGNFSSDSAGN